MKRRNMLIITLMGGVYRISRANLVKALQSIAEGKDFEIEEIATFLGARAQDLTDLSPEEAQSLLEDYASSSGNHLTAFPAQ